MQTFYFTYGTCGQPFRGGWTKITAPNAETACAVFRAIHPKKDSNLLNCCSVYTEEQLKETEMYSNGNFGCFCHETITVTIESNH